MWLIEPGQKKIKKIWEKVVCRRAPGSGGRRPTRRHKRPCMHQSYGTSGDRTAVQAPGQNTGPRAAPSASASHTHTHTHLWSGENRRGSAGGRRSGKKAHTENNVGKGTENLAQRRWHVQQRDGSAPWENKKGHAAGGQRRRRAAAAAAASGGGNAQCPSVTWLQQTRNPEWEARAQG